ncbi:MAG: rane protein [Candidatus Eremiobacteraeota bacterium]|jgi:membrane protein|nr:rane protein [Candidatus Eremiobacteraeota bacterium]
MAAFAALALAPLLVITLRVAQLFGGRPAVVHGLSLVITPIVGHGGVRSLEAVGANARSAGNGILATALSIAIALFAGSRLFYAMQRALHAMWDTPVRRTSSLATTVASFLSAGVLSVCFVAVLTVVIFGSAFLSAAVHGAGADGVLASLAVRAGIAVLGAAILAPIVACLFKWLPGTELTWGDVWIGALTTTIGFAVAQFAIAVYLAKVNLPWTYGSASSVVVVLLWLYYSSYLFLLGAEFTHVYAHEHGSLRRRTVRHDGTPAASA